jgi:acetyl-CoA synthetase
VLYIIYLFISVLFSSLYGLDESIETKMLSKEAFWEQEANRIDWFRKWDKVLVERTHYDQWYFGGKLNACYNCVDRHLKSNLCNRTALIWEGEEGEERSYTYKDLYTEINQFSNVLKNLGVKKGDVVVLYMPMIPETIIAMLSCARIGAVHNVVFAGFTAGALNDRITDSGAKIIITADAGRRRGNIIPLKETTDLAISSLSSIQNIVVVRHSNHSINMKKGRDHWYEDLMQKAEAYCPLEEMNSDDPLFILYTSGTTGKPKGIVHSTGGYMVAVTSTMHLLQNSKPSDVFFSLADLGWMGGHNCVLYGPLSNGETQLMYEGAIDYPNRDRIWKLIEKYKVSCFYTSPTAIRTFMKWGGEYLQKHDLSSLRSLFSMGEPLNPEAWDWFYSELGQKKCKIIDCWGQTETGALMMASISDSSALKPGSVGSTLPGMRVKVVDEEGNDSDVGHVVITESFPSMLLGIYNDPKRYEDSYWKKWNGAYFFTGDEARIDADGDFHFMGRIDDIINVSGHKLSSVELEGVLTSYPGVVEVAVVGAMHEIKGQSLVAFVVLKNESLLKTTVEKELKDHIVNQVGAFARLDRVIFTKDLPKTRTGKVMRRLLRDMASGKVLGDLSTVLDASVLDTIKIQYDEAI